MKQREFEKLVEGLRKRAAEGPDETRKSNGNRATNSHGNTLQPSDITALRQKMGTSQEEFALMIGVSVRTLRTWEDGIQMPDGPARALLRVAVYAPDTVVRALSTG